MDDVAKSLKILVFYKTKIAFVSLYCGRNMNDASSTRKIPEITRLRFVFSLGIFLDEMTSFLFLFQHRDTQAILYL